MFNRTDLLIEITEYFQIIAATGTTVIAMTVTAKYLKYDRKAMPLGFNSNLKLEKKNFAKNCLPFHLLFWK